MSNVLMRHDIEDVVQPDPKAALEAALLRASQVPTSSRSILDLISKDDWEKMDCTGHNVNVFDPD